MPVTCCPGCGRAIPVADEELGALVITCAACETRFVPSAPRGRPWRFCAAYLLMTAAALALVGLLACVGLPSVYALLLAITLLLAVLVFHVVFRG